MSSMEIVKKALQEKGFAVSHFATAAEATSYLNGEIDGKSVGFGGSMTLKELGLYETLSAHNECHWHWEGGPTERPLAATCQIYLSSVNGMSEDGQMINIDGAGNRVASTLFGHEKLYLVVGQNKLAPTYDEALWRARNIAGPKNAKKLGKKTPCAVNGDRCFDCKSPERICRGLVVLWEPMMSMATEVVLVDENLGF